MGELNEVIRKLRGKDSLRDAAKKTGVSHTYLSILEKGYDLRSKNPIKPTPETLRLISAAYAYSYVELLKLAGYMDEAEMEENQERQRIKEKQIVEAVKSLPDEKLDFLLEVIRQIESKK